MYRSPDPLKNGVADVLRAIYTILNDLILHFAPNIVLLAPAIVGVMRKYLELTEKLKSEKEVALMYYKRLVMFIIKNNDIKLKIGLCLGFLFPLLAKLQIIFPGNFKKS